MSNYQPGAQPPQPGFGPPSAYPAPAQPQPGQVPPPSGHGHPQPGYGTGPHPGYGYGPGYPYAPQPQPGYGPSTPPPSPGGGRRTGLVVAGLATAVALAVAGVLVVPRLLPEDDPDPAYELRSPERFAGPDGLVYALEEDEDGNDHSGTTYPDLSADGKDLTRVNPTFRAKDAEYPFYSVSAAYGAIKDPEAAMNAQMQDKRDRGFKVVGTPRDFDPRASGDEGDVRIRCVVLERHEEGDTDYYMGTCGWANRSTMGMVAEFAGNDGARPSESDLEELCEMTITIRKNMQVAAGSSNEHGART